MKWRAFKYDNPKESGPYVVSLQRRGQVAIVVTNYVAYYDLDIAKWYKYDPFVDKYTPKEEITDMVTAWIEGVTSFLS